MNILWWLLAGHFIADYPLQSDFMAMHKARKSSLLAVPWYYVLTSHAVTHGVAVALATDSVMLGSLEMLAHWLIDHAKCEGLTNIHVDQALHVACKLAWFGLLRLAA